MSEKILGKEFDKLIESLSKLPSIGEKTASRLALYLMKNPPDLTLQIAKSMVEARKKVKICHICNNFIFNKSCICSDKSRNKKLLCIVENVFDLISIEQGGHYNGQYHVLQGLLSASKGVSPKDLNIEKLISKIKKTNYDEIIFATDPTSDGELTAQFIFGEIKNYCKSISRIAIGMPIGSEVDYIDKNTLAKSFIDRKRM